MSDRICTAFETHDRVFYRERGISIVEVLKAKEKEGGAGEGKGRGGVGKREEGVRGRVGMGLEYLECTFVRQHHERHQKI